MIAHPSLDDLVHELLSGKEDHAEAVADELAQRGQPALQRLLEITHSDEAEHRWWAARSLALFTEDRAVDGLIELLADPDQSVRHCAALSLRLNPSTRAIPALSKLLDHKDRLLSRLAGDALTAIGGPSIPALAEAMKSPNAQVRIEASRALSRMHNSAAIPILFEGLNDPSGVVQHWVETGLSELGVGMVFFDV